MIFQEEFYLNFPVEDAWRFFTDFPSPIMVLPGVQKVQEVGPQQYLGAIQAHIGPFTFLFRGDLNITKVDQRTREVVLTGSAHDHNLGGHFTATAHTRTLSAGPNRSRITLEVHVGLDGLMGKLGMWILKPKAHSIVQHYAKLVSQELATRRRSELALSHA